MASPICSNVLGTGWMDGLMIHNESFNMHMHIHIYIWMIHNESSPTVSIYLLLFQSRPLNYMYSK